MANKGDFITGVIVGAVALLAPIGFVVVEGQMKPERPPKVIAKKGATQAPVERSALEIEAAAFAEQQQSKTTAAPVAQVEVPSPESSSSDDPFVADNNADAPDPRRSADWFGGASNLDRKPMINEPLDADHEDAPAPNVSPAMRAALAEVGLSSRISEPEPEAVIEPPSAAELAAASLEATETESMPQEMPDELSEEDRKIAAQFDQQVAAQKSVGTVVVEGSKTPASKTTPEPKADERKRCKVTFIRPKANVVNSIEPLLIKTSVKGHPVVFVKSRESSSPWYVQETGAKQGTYVQAKGRFGNAKTPEGAPFRIVVAFITKVEDIPDHGTELKKLPDDWLLSQEVLVTLKRQ